MHLDAWVSMVVFTLATVSFYLLGATILYRLKLHPSGSNMIAELAKMYVEVFGQWTWYFFLIGSWAVLFKTLYVASAAHSRLTSDFFSMAGFVKYENSHARLRMIRNLCVFFPMLALVFYLVVGEPRGMVTFGGFAQGITLPIIAGATLYLRYKETDRRIAPSWITDVAVWLAFILCTVLAVKAVWDQVLPWFG